MAALRALGHDVTCVDYLTENVSAVAGIAWDLALFSKCEPVELDTIKRFACRKAMWIFDSLHDTSMHKMRAGADALIDKGKVMDRLFTAALGDLRTYRASGCDNAYFLPQACDDRIFFDRGPGRDLDITFVGNNYGIHRIEIIRQVHERYGERFKLFSKTATWGVPIEKALTQVGAAKVFSASKITLNMSEIPEDDKWSRRVWDAMGCGAVVAAQYCPSFARFFKDEMVTWGNIYELFQVIDELLADPDMLRSVSEKAQALIQGQHTYRHRVKELLTVMGLRT